MRDGIDPRVSGVGKNDSNHSANGFIFIHFTLVLLVFVLLDSFVIDVCSLRL